jgi:phosphoribosylformylglycinamidine synthase
VVVDTDADSADAARAAVKAMCEKLLANPVTEDYEIASVERA